jgi:hypothetical protein
MYNGANCDANLCFINAAMQLVLQAMRGVWDDLDRCRGAAARAVRLLGEAVVVAAENSLRSIGQARSRFVMRSR